MGRRTLRVCTGSQKTTNILKTFDMQHIQKKRRLSATATLKKESAVKKLSKKVTALALSRPVQTRYVAVYNGTGSGNFKIAAPATILLNGIAEGSDEINRVGDRGRCKWLDLKVYVFNQGINLMLGTFQVRLMVVREKTALGSTIQYAQLLQNAAPQTYTLRNYITRDHNRFEVLYDQTKTIGPLANSAAAVYNGYNNNAPSNITFDVKKLKLDFITDYSRGNAGTIADIETNSLHFLLFTDNPVDSSLGAQYSSVCAIDF